MNNKAKVIIMMSAAVLLSNYTVYAFSDEYEPIYPQKTAVTRSVEELWCECHHDKLQLWTICYTI